MAEAATIARPYARAAFDAAGRHGGLAKWGTLLAKAAAVVSDERVAALLGNPHVRAQELVGLVLELAGGEGDEPARNYVQLLADNRRLALLPEISAQFDQLRADFESTADVTVTSALPLTPEQAGKLSAALSKRLGRTVKLHAEVDPSLIGGAIVRAGDFVMDGSLRGRIERLAGAMAAG
jgi:F-type H+-transporting ATPase subunit delta